MNGRLWPESNWRIYCRVSVFSGRGRKRRAFECDEREVGCVGGIRTRYLRPYGAMPKDGALLIELRRIACWLVASERAKIGRISEGTEREVGERGLNPLLRWFRPTPYPRASPVRVGSV